jgi:AAHS family 3-hydroxyphenylpropionic acid transporter
MQRVARPGLVVLTCFVIAALEGYDLQSYGVALPFLAKRFGLDPGRLGWLGGMAMLGILPGALWGGRIADRVGRKPVLIVSVLVFGLFSIATGVADSTITLFLARFVSGLGFGGAIPNLIAVGTEITERRRHASTVTLMFCGMPTGGAAVALLARLGGAGLDWRTIFYVGGILPLMLLPMIWKVLPETRPQHEEKQSGALRMLFGQGRAAATVLIWAAYVLTLLILYLLLNWLKELVISKGMAASVADTSTFSFNFTSIVGAAALGFVIDRFGTRWPLALTYLCLSASLAALSISTAANHIVVLSGLVGFLVIGAQYSLYSLPPRYYGPHERAAGAGAAVGVGRIGAVLGPVLGGTLRGSGMSADSVLLGLAPLALVAGVFVFVLSFRPYCEPSNESAQEV